MVWNDEGRCYEVSDLSPHLEPDCVHSFITIQVEHITLRSVNDPIICEHIIIFLYNFWI